MYEFWRRDASRLELGSYIANSVTGMMSGVPGYCTSLPPDGCTQEDLARDVLVALVGMHIMGGEGRINKMKGHRRKHVLEGSRDKARYFCSCVRAEKTV